MKSFVAFAALLGVSLAMVAPELQRPRVAPFRNFGNRMETVAAPAEEKKISKREAPLLHWPGLFAPAPPQQAVAVQDSYGPPAVAVSVQDTYGPPPAVHENYGPPPAVHENYGPPPVADAPHDTADCPQDGHWVDDVSNVVWWNPEDGAAVVPVEPVVPLQPPSSPTWVAAPAPVEPVVPVLPPSLPTWAPAPAPVEPVVPVLPPSLPTWAPAPAPVEPTWVPHADYGVPETTTTTTTTTTTPAPEVTTQEQKPDAQGPYPPKTLVATHYGAPVVLPTFYQRFF